MIPEYGRQRPPVTASPEVERELRRRAVRSVCALVATATDARLVLDALGLDPRDGLDDRASSATPAL